MTTGRRDSWTMDDEAYPPRVALWMIHDGVPLDGIVAYLLVASMVEAGVDPWLVG